LRTSEGVALLFEFGIVHIMLEFLYFLDVLLIAGLFIRHVFLVEDELSESFLGQILHFVDDYICVLYF
jgi:hypothetical protein